MKQLFLAILLTLFMLPATSQESRLLRFPAVHGDQVVFSYGGDLYSVDTEDKLARKLTNHKGYEMFPKFSPDGSKIAFTAQYDGNTEKYIPCLLKEALPSA